MEKADRYCEQIINGSEGSDREPPGKEECMAEAQNRLLNGRALDLTDAQGFVCGRMLAAYGVDVIKIEQPGGDLSRLKAPYIGESVDPDKSIYWNTFNADKRDVTLDLTKEEGRRIFLDMVKSADYVIESYAPGYLESVGLGYSALKEVNPKIVLTSITPFGQNTTRKNWRGGELICSALGATMDNIGDPDRAPLLEPADTNTYYANICAVTASIMAHYHATITGEGDHVDVSIEECAANRNPQGQLSWSFNQKLIGRLGPFNKFGSAKVRTIWECKDGFVNWTMFAGPMGAKPNEALSNWMTEDGLYNPLAEITYWPDFDLSALSEEKLRSWEDAMAVFFKGHTKEEFRIEGAKRRLAATVLDGPDDRYKNHHLAARFFWEDIDCPELGDKKIALGRYFVQANDVDTYVHAKAPFAGQDNEEIFGREFGLDCEALRERGVI